MLLPYLIIIPFFGGIICCFIERFIVRSARWIALITIGSVLMIALQLWWLQKEYMMTQVASGIPQWQSSFLMPWISRFGINFYLAIDGLSLLMVILTGFLGLMSVLCSWNEINKYEGYFYLNLMCILGSVIGVFLSMDLFLFFFFWEIMLIPIYFLISIWGHKKSSNKTRNSAATKLFIYSQSSGLIMFVAILVLVFIHYNSTGIFTFNYVELLKTSMSHHIEYLLMLAFFIAFAVKMPIVPFHGWLPDAHSNAPTAGSVDLSGFLLKTSAYGFLRFILPLFPHASAQFTPIAILLGIIGIFYGAWMAFSQTDIKRIISYSSLSHMGFVLIAIYSGNKVALQGAVIQMITHALSAAALFILSGQLYERLHTRDIRKMGGLWSHIKWMPAISLFFAVANISMPGTGNFIGEFMILIGSFQVMPLVVAIASFGLVFSSIYSLRMIHFIYYGKTQLKKETLSEMSFRECAISGILIILIILIGLYPQFILDTSRIAISNIQHWFITSTITNIRF